MVSRVGGPRTRGMSGLCLVKSGIVRWLVTRLGLETGGIV